MNHVFQDNTAILRYVSMVLWDFYLNTVKTSNFTAVKALITGFLSLTYNTTPTVAMPSLLMWHCYSKCENVWKVKKYKLFES